MKILIGTIVRQRAKTLEAYLTTLAWQRLPEGVEVEYLFINDLDPSADDYQECEDLLRLWPQTKVETQVEGFAADEVTHNWNVELFRKMGHEKQRLLDYAVQEDFDAIWLVDSDLLCDVGTLASLIACDKPIVSGVFWTAWVPGAPMQPQVWLEHPYGLSGGMIKHEHEFLGALVDRKLVQVLGLGACTLIRTEALEHVRFDPPLPDLPQDGMWQGEDRHFCVRANRAHVPLYADGWPNIAHIYRPSYEEHIPAILQELREDLQHPTIGNLVNFTIEELQTPSLHGHKQHVRGRLGGLKIAPEIETDLLDMKVGQQIISKVAFPPWYELEHLRGQDRYLQITLTGVRRYNTPVGLADTSSSAAHRFYTPCQLQTMMATQIERPVDGATSHCDMPDAAIEGRECSDPEYAGCEVLDPHA